MILYVDEKEIYPMFGCYSSDGTIKIRKDLPQIVKDFLLVHELYHSTDKAKFWLWREIKANWAGAVQHPRGGLVTLFMSFAPYRLKYYYQRVKTKQ